MNVSVLSPYCFQENLGNLGNCLNGLRSQTMVPAQIIICDDSEESARDRVRSMCEQYSAEYVAFPFADYKPQFAGKFNEAFKIANGDMILILCSNWILTPNWLKEMATTLEQLGRGNMVAGDSARKKMNDAQGNPIDWFAGYPDFFELTHGAKGASGHDYVDEGFLNLMYTVDWLPWDEDFDNVGAWHAVVEWGYRLIQNGMRIWIRRDLEAEHQERYPRPEWLEQTHESHVLLNSKGVK